MQNVFFGSEGLTMTSANHIANLAKEFTKTVEQELNSVSLYDTSLTVIGSDHNQVIHKGWIDEQLSLIGDNLQKIAEANSLIAWLREAIKEHHKLMAVVELIGLREYLEETHRELPEEPVREKGISKEYYIELMSIKERSRIYSLQTQAAVIGKYIHPDGPFSRARQAMLTKVTNPTEVSGNGRDTLIYQHTVSATGYKVENTFYELQQLHRSVQAELNGYLHKIDVAVQKDADEKTAAYLKAKSEYQRTIAELTEEMENAKMARLDAIRAYRIIIPNELKGIYEIVSALGKK